MRRLVAVLLALGVMAPVAAAQVAAVPSPAVEGPIASDPVGSPSHDYPFGAATQDLRRAGYTEREYFYSGDTPVGAYKTRMLVRRPADPAKFSGTVIVEWQNVTNLYDLDALWIRSAKNVMRDGDAYVAIDAQTDGVTSPTGLKAYSPERYGSLHFPALAAATKGVPYGPDAGMFDIFGQGLQAIRHPKGVAPLGGLTARQVLATGTSQSALMLFLYSQTYDLLQRLTDGFLITAGSTATLGQTGHLTVALPQLVNVVPVMWLNTETDESAHHQGDGALYHLWEVAGTTHLDRDARDVQQVIVKRDFGKDLKPLDCLHTPFSRIPFRYAQNAAVEALKSWASTGFAPPSQPAFEYDAAGNIRRDGFGNALGGVRMPQFEVPTATNTRTNTGPCKALYGSYIPFSTQRLRLLYPTHADYVAKVRAAAAADVKAGVLLDADADETIAAAQASSYPCASTRIVVLHIPRRAGGRAVLRARVTAGDRAPLLVRGRRARISLAGFDEPRVRVRIALRLSDGRVLTSVRRFAQCPSAG